MDNTSKAAVSDEPVRMTSEKWAENLPVDMQHSDLRRYQVCRELGFLASSANTPFVEHCYGSDVHILNSARALTLVAEMGRLPAGHPRLYEIVAALTEILMNAIIDREFPLAQYEVPTGMAAVYPEENVAYRGQIIDPQTQVCLVELPRAGTHVVLPAMKLAAQVVDYRNVWYDHIPSERVVNEKGEIVGSQLGAPKFSGRQIGANTKLLLLDPMLATGGTIIAAIEEYKKAAGRYGMPQARDIICGAFVGTPEGITRIKKECPGAQVYLLRLDRGRSLELSKVLASTPGYYPELERGLTNDERSNSYIYPGAGGMGEKLANAFNETPVVKNGKTTQE